MLALDDYELLFTEKYLKVSYDDWNWVIEMWESHNDCAPTIVAHKKLFDSNRFRRTKVLDGFSQMVIIKKESISVLLTIPFIP